MVQIKAVIDNSLISGELIPEEQKGCRKGTIEIGKQLYIDEHILKESKMRRKMLQWRRLIKQRYTIWSRKAG